MVLQAWPAPIQFPTNIHFTRVEILEPASLQLTVDVKNPYGDNFGIILKIFTKSVQHVAIV